MNALAFYALLSNKTKKILPANFISSLCRLDWLEWGWLRASHADRKVGDEWRGTTKAQQSRFNFHLLYLQRKLPEQKTN